MINQFISSIVAIFYWGKTSSKTMEKILHASWVKTFVYGFLTIVVFVLFYKTYQVATVINMIQLTGIKQACDSSEHVLDTVKNVCIVHRLAENSMQQGDFLVKGIKEFSKDKEIDEKLSQSGGTYIEIHAFVHPYKYIQQKFDGYDEIAQRSFEMELDNNNIPHENVNHLYQLFYLATNIPSFIPFYPKLEGGHDYEYCDNHIFYNSNIGNSRNNPLISFRDDYTNKGRQFYVKNDEEIVNLPDVLNNGLALIETMGTINIEEIDYDYARLGLFAFNDITNKLNIFTAADISQYTYVLSLSSDCPVKRLYIDYDIPIETAQIDENMIIGTRGITLDSVFVKKMQRSPSIVFHIKFPSLANLQLIRSLVLTTLLTALFSLFCRNLYFCIRKWAYKRREKNRIPIGVARKFSEKTKEKIKHGVRSFNRILYTLLLSIVIGIIVLLFIVIRNTSILIPEVLFDYKYFIFIVVMIFIFIAIIIYYAYKKIQKPLSLALSGVEEPEPQELDNDFSTIFIHERNEDEEYDRLVEEQLKESSSQVDEEVLLEKEFKEDEDNGTK